MAKGGVKVKDYEKLTDSNIKKVIDLLSASPPITKKDACIILNIAYNTTRLSKIIENYQEKVALTKKMKAKKKGVPPDKDEIKWIVQSFIRGESIADIAKTNYRSATFINNLIERVGVPERAKGDDAFKVSLLPENCVADTFDIGEIAWSAKYHAPCKILKNIGDNYKLYESSCYRIWVVERSDETFNQGGFCANQLAYDLGKLAHLNEYGIDASTL